MSSIFKYPLGIRATDKINGFYGYCVARQQTVTRAIQYAVKLEAKENSPGDILNLDVDNLVFDTSINFTIMDEDPNFKFDIFDKVRCSFSGFTGTISCRSQHVNKCNQYYVCSKKLSKKGKPIYFWFDEIELELIKKSIKTETKNATITGGPDSKFDGKFV